MAVKRISALFLVIGLIFAQTGCGKTGQLYLADEKVHSSSEKNQPESNQGQPVSAND